MKTILLTGAAGGVAGMIRPILRADYRLRLSDAKPIPNPVTGEEVVLANLTDMAALKKAVAGVDGIIHLGGYSRETDWDGIHAANIIGVHNVFEAARLAGVKRLVFASSNHAMGYYPRSQTIPVDITVRPDSRYGLSKAFGEAVGSLYAYKYDMEVMSIRIGNVAVKPVNDLRQIAIWISPRDLCQLIRIGLERPGIRHEIVYGASDNKRTWWDNSAAYRLGYKPQDKSEDYATALEEAGKNGFIGKPKADLNQGGAFCTEEDF
jgi:uronate dehydrogenase